jgi:hypothetical protein
MVYFAQLPGGAIKIGSSEYCAAHMLKGGGK